MVVRSWKIPSWYILGPADGTAAVAAPASVSPGVGVATTWTSFTTTTVRSITFSNGTSRTTSCPHAINKKRLEPQIAKQARYTRFRLA